MVMIDDDGVLYAKKKSEVEIPQYTVTPTLMDKHDSHLKKNKVGEPNKW